VASSFVLALVNGVPVCFLHYSIVWAVIEGVDVVAHNWVLVSLSLRTTAGAPLITLWRRC
jgi:hypothetical protein